MLLKNRRITYLCLPVDGWRRIEKNFGSRCKKTPYVAGPKKNLWLLSVLLFLVLVFVFVVVGFLFCFVFVLFCFCFLFLFCLFIVLFLFLFCYYYFFFFFFWGGGGRDLGIAVCMEVFLAVVFGRINSNSCPVSRSCWVGFQFHYWLHSFVPCFVSLPVVSLFVWCFLSIFVVVFFLYLMWITCKCSMIPFPVSSETYFIS